jgi:hypothetical protein
MLSASTPSTHAFLYTRHTQSSRRREGGQLFRLTLNQPDVVLVLRKWRRKLVSGFEHFALVASLGLQASLTASEATRSEVQGAVSCNVTFEALYLRCA